MLAVCCVCSTVAFYHRPPVTLAGLRITYEVGDEYVDPKSGLAWLHFPQSAKAATRVGGAPPYGVASPMMSCYTILLNLISSLTSLRFTHLSACRDVVWPLRCSVCLAASMQLWPL
jgi:hypothetical protein